MEIVKYLKAGNSLESLYQNYRVKSKVYDDRICFGYEMEDGHIVDDISIKEHPIMVECRGLILSREYDIISRSFDRFFNYGEVDHSNFNFNDFKIMNKEDGSLIKIYHHKDKWHISTKGTAFAESEIPFSPNLDYHVTFHDFIMEHIFVDKQRHSFFDFTYFFDKNCTYMFEFVSPMNKIILDYDKHKLVFLAKRENQTGIYKDLTVDEALTIFDHENVTTVEKFDFPNNIEEIKEIINSKELNEGVIIVDNNFNMIKIKTDEYIDLHYKKGGMVTSKRIANMIYDNDYEEFLTYFPEYQEKFDFYFNKIDKINEYVNKRYHELYNDDNKIMAENCFNSDIAIFTKDLMRKKKNNKEIDVKNETLRTKFLEVMLDERFDEL